MDSRYLFPKGPVQVSFLSGQLCFKSWLFLWTPDVQTQQPTQEVYDGLSPPLQTASFSLLPALPNAGSPPMGPSLQRGTHASPGYASQKLEGNPDTSLLGTCVRQSILKSAVRPAGTCRFCSFSVTICWHSCNNFLTRLVQTGPLYPPLQSAVNRVSFLLGSETSIRV